jgi:hypothetical protein
MMSRCVELLDGKGGIYLLWDYRRVCSGKFWNK